MRSAICLIYQPQYLLLIPSAKPSLGAWRLQSAGREGPGECAAVTGPWERGSVNRTRRRLGKDQKKRAGPSGLQRTQPRRPRGVAGTKRALGRARGAGWGDAGSLQSPEQSPALVLQPAPWPRQREPQQSEADPGKQQGGRGQLQDTVPSASRHCMGASHTSLSHHDTQV